MGCKNTRIEPQSLLNNDEYKVWFSNTSHSDNHGTFKVEALKKNVLKDIAPYYKDIELRLYYLIAVDQKD